MEHWYVLRSKPRKENFLLEQLCLNGYEAYCPFLRVKPVNPRARKARPYFPGYVFLHADLSRVNASALHWMPGTVGFVSFEGTPTRVPDELIPAIRARVEAVNAAGGEMLLEMQPGDPVRVTGGIFEGYEAIFDVRLPGSERVRILLSLIRQARQVPVELSAAFIQKKGKR